MFLARFESSLGILRAAYLPSWLEEGDAIASMEGRRDWGCKRSSAPRSFTTSRPVSQAAAQRRRGVCSNKRRREKNAFRFLTPASGLAFRCF